MSSDNENNIKFENIMNKEDGSLPYAFFNPETEGKLTWMCGYDAEQKITSVFCFDHGTHKDKVPNYVESIEKAEFMRQEIINSGWKKLTPPDITFTFPGEKEPRKMNRKERRYLDKKVKNMNKKNPFNSATST
jgi:hypothetical protein